MRIVLTYITLLLALPVFLVGQVETKSEIYAGVQFGHYGSVHTWDPFSGMSADENNASINVNDIGWDVAYTRHLDQSFGITADFNSGLLGGASSQEGVAGYLQAVHYHIHIFNAAFGPQYTFGKKGEVKPFVHFLIGGGYASGSACSSGAPCTSLGSADHYGVSQGGVVAYLGGGVDKKCGKSLSLRGQFDWFHSYAEYGGNGNIRLSGGVVYHF